MLNDMYLLAALLLPTALPPTGSVLSSRGQLAVHGWDGSKRTTLRLSEALSPLDELTTEGDGAIKLALGPGLSVVVGPSSKLVLVKLENELWTVRLEYGRMRTVAAKQRIKIETPTLSLTPESGEFVCIVEAGKSQVVVLQGNVKVQPQNKPEVGLSAPQAVDVALSVSAPYTTSDKTVRELRTSLDLDETPTTEIAQALETDLPGFVGPRASRVRWRGISEGYGEGAPLAQPFNQTPVKAGGTGR